MLFVSHPSFRAPWPSLPSLLICRPFVEHTVVQDPAEGPAWAEDREGGIAKMNGTHLLPDRLQGCKVFGNLLDLSFQRIAFKCFLGSCARHYQHGDERTHFYSEDGPVWRGHPARGGLGTLQKKGAKG